MADMKLLYELDDILEKELKNVVKKGEVPANEWENLKRLVCIMKEVKEVEQMLMEEGYDDGYSSRSYNTHVSASIVICHSRSKLSIIAS